LEFFREKSSQTSVIQADALLETNRTPWIRYFYTKQAVTHGVLTKTGAS
jgi:hypothetical protein